MEGSLKTQLGPPSKYNDRQYVRRFAFFPTQVMRKSDSTPFRVWLDYYFVEQQFYEWVADWKDLGSYLEEPIEVVVER